jgi:hypothetical protein
MTFTSPISLFLAVLITLTIFIFAWVRRPALPGVSLWLAAGGIIALALAAGGVSCRRGKEMKFAVMVDCSPSTRGASFRDAGWLRSRIHELIGSRPYSVYGFSDGVKRISEDDAIEEMGAERTVLGPPQEDAVLLFSDGRLDAAAVMPPVFAVVDPALDSPSDAAVVDLENHGDQIDADVRNTGEPRTLEWIDRQRTATTAPSGSVVLSTKSGAGHETITARLSAGDLWPENDALSIRPSPAMASQRWWVGDSPPGGWVDISAGDLPLEASAWLGPAIVVLNNVPSDALSAQQQDRLSQYVRDLGGALVIVGGDHAFAAGDYAGSQLEALSPLSSSPPEPVTHWVLLVDSSGSMATTIGNTTRFKAAADAVVAVLRKLPRADLVSIGSFAQELRWWSVAKDVLDTSLISLPPDDVAPNGPTNLEAALKQIAASLPSSPPIDLLVISDTEAEFGDAAALAKTLADHHIRVHALAIGDAPADSALHRIAAATGGQFVAETDPHGWAASVRKMLRAEMPDRIVAGPVNVSFGGVLDSLAARTAPAMNRTWLKQSATQVGTGNLGNEKMPAAARWVTGSGDVMALSFRPTAEEIAAIDHVIAKPPRDPRFQIRWKAGAMLHVRIDARDSTGYLNDQALAIEFGAGGSQAIPQTGPGQYEVDLPTPRQPVTATILNGAQVLDRVALAGRYPREFDEVGNDLDALRALAERSGGKVIEASQHGQIEFPESREITSVAGGMAMIGVLLLGISLTWWRLGSN